MLCVYTGSGASSLSASGVHIFALSARLHSCGRLGWVHLSRAACEVGRGALCRVATAWTCLGSGAGLGEQGAWVTRAGRQSPGRVRRPARAGTPKLAPAAQGQPPSVLPRPSCPPLGPFSPGSSTGPACTGPTVTLHTGLPLGRRSEGPRGGLTLGTPQLLAMQRTRESSFS